MLKGVNCNIMMKPQSVEFIKGYLFAQLERKLIKRKHEYGCKTNVSCEADVPLLWFGIKNPNNPYCDLYTARTAAEVIAKELETTLMDVFTKDNVQIIVTRDKQYFTFTCACIPQTKHMTIKQIEDALGHYVKIIPEVTSDD